jgi:serine/threonine protein kinase
VVKEIPISSRELRQELLDIITPWHRAQKQFGHLLKVNSTFWNVPEGCVSIVFEYLSGNSLTKLIDSVGSIPEFILSKVIKEVSKGVQFMH